jgi:hypothetical protein
MLQYRRDTRCRILPNQARRCTEPDHHAMCTWKPPNSRDEPGSRKLIQRRFRTLREILHCCLLSPVKQHNNGGKFPRNSLRFRFDYSSFWRETRGFRGRQVWAGFQGIAGTCTSKESWPACIMRRSVPLTSSSQSRRPSQARPSSPHAARPHLHGRPSSAGTTRIRVTPASSSTRAIRREVHHLSPPPTRAEMQVHCGFLRPGMA